MKHKTTVNMKLYALGLILLFACTSSAVPARSPPTFARNYFVEGILLLPYAEIKEPFRAYYDEGSRKSRIDYYGDTVLTYQRADKGQYGVSYKLAFMPDENGTPERTCFQVDGTQNNTVAIQSVLPHLGGFEYVGTENCFAENALVSSEIKHSICEVWRSENVVNDKKNTYTMYILQSTGEPVHYIMKGFNNLLGSHYDKYELYYMNYTEGAAKDEDFEVLDGLTCRGFPGPGVENMVLMNPLREYVGNEDNHIIEKFDDFKNKHNKVYENDEEHEKRRNIFRQNYRYIQSMNRAGHTYYLKLNHMADYSDFEMRMIRGRLSSSGYNGGQAFDEEYSEQIPDNLDWRLYGAVTPVKDQAVCGSCWSFGTTGTIEGAYFLKTNSLVRLSQQQLIDCSWQYQNNGCDGGEDFRAYAYIMATGGLASEDDYGQYMGQDGICHESAVPKTAKITGFVNVTSGDLNALKLAIAKKGPISVSIDASHKSFSFYSHGVYYEPDCKNGENELDHSVLAVGYGVMNNEPYWIVKNSWSTYWGNDGYVLMSQKDNNCGVATSPTYVLM